MTRPRKPHPARLFSENLNEPGNHFSNRLACVPTWWRRLVLGPRPRLTRPVWAPQNSSVAETGLSLLETGESPCQRRGLQVKSRRTYESVRSGLRLLAQAMQLPHHRARQAAAQCSCGVLNRDLRCLPRLWPRVPVRLVQNEDARV